MCRVHDVFCFLSTQPFIIKLARMTMMEKKWKRKASIGWRSRIRAIKERNNSQDTQEIDLLISATVEVNCIFFAWLSN